jgi:gamma-glutamyltranspeptidase/glutathione hydrolase
MDDFSIKPGTENVYKLVGGDANAIVPGKRMLSSMTPTFLDSGRGVAILGTPGGSRIITMVLLSTLAWLDGADAEEMVSLPRYHHQFLPDEIKYEGDAFSAGEVQQLRSMGHTLTRMSRRYGNMQAITWDYESGEVEAASDPRYTIGGPVRIY